MAPRQDGDIDTDDAERARFSKKLDGYEAMGLDVDDLRRLLEEDMEEFKATYLGVIRTQLEGGKEEPSPEEPVVEEEEVPEEIQVEQPPEDTEDEGPKPDKEPPEEVEEEEPSEEVSEEEADEEIELQLEGAGPEEALAAPDIPEEEPDEEAITPEEEGPSEEDITEEEEIQISIEEEVVTEEVEPVAEEEVEPPEEEAEIEVAKAPEEEPPEEVPEELEQEEEALVVVAEVIEEGPEAEIRLDGLRPEERVEEEEEAPEEEVEPGPEPAPEPVEEPESVPPKKRPVKKVVPKKTVSKAEAPKKAPPQKGPPKKGPAKKAPAKKKAPPPKPKKRPIPLMVVAILVALLIVIASAGSYFLFLKNEDPIALFSFDPGEPLVGKIVTFDARNSTDPDDGTIEKYVWDFGDGTSGKGRVVDHSYIEASSFLVRLTIEDDHGGRATTQRTVEVGTLEISMERPYLSDLFQYDVEGIIELSNTVDGLFRFKGPTGAWEYIYVIKADVIGEKTFEVTRTRLGKDGFMKGHDDARVERTFYDLTKIRGTLETSMSVNPSFIGSMEATVEEDVCQHWERGIRSTVAVYTDVSANVASQDWASLSTVDEGTFYSQLTGIENTFSLNEFLRNTTFSSEDRDPYPLKIGESTYLWQVKGMERVEERPVPSLHINVTMDRDTLQANDLDNFFIDVWLEPGLSQPAKYHVYVKGHEEGNRYKVNMTETLGSVSMGSDEAWNLPCRANHSYTVKGEYPEDFNQLDRVPEQGGTTGGYQFNPEDAYQDALTDPQFLKYVTDNPNAFFHLGNYTENGNVGRWVMAFGQRGNSEHNEVDARGTSSVDINTDVDDYIDDKLPLDSPGSIGEIVTLSRGIRLLRAEPEIASLCFDGQDPDWSGYTFNVTEGVSTISLDPTSVLVGAQETGYVYMLVSRSGPLDHRAALDATNGQVLFTWIHSETFDTFEGFG